MFSVRIHTMRTGTYEFYHDICFVVELKIVEDKTKKNRRRGKEEVKGQKQGKTLLSYRLKTLRNFKNVTFDSKKISNVVIKAEQD